MLLDPSVGQLALGAGVGVEHGAVGGVAGGGGARRIGGNPFEEGREHAKRIGEAFRLHRVPVDRVLSSPWCRCVETASLAFGSVELSPALANLFGRSESRQKQVAELNADHASIPGPVYDPVADRYSAADDPETLSLANEVASRIAAVLG
jgi:hypothetical protein